MICATLSCIRFGPDAFQNVSYFEFPQDLTCAALSCFSRRENPDDVAGVASQDFSPPCLPSSPLKCAARPVKVASGRSSKWLARPYWCKGLETRALCQLLCCSPKDVRSSTSNIFSTKMNQTNFHFAAQFL